MPPTNREIAMILSLKDEATATLNQVDAKVKELNKEIRNIERGTDDYKRHADQIKVLREAQSQFNADVGKTPTAVNQVTAAWERLRPVIAATLSIATVRELVSASNEQELATAKLTQALKTQGATSSVVRDEMEAYSKSVEKVTTFSDEEVTKVQALLVSMTGLTGSALNPLTKATLDLASGLGIDAEEAARLIAKSEEGSDGLKRLGIEIGKTTSEQERIAKITEEVERRFGGMAEAAGETAAGKLKEFRNQVNNLEEAFGTIIKNAGGSLLPILTEVTNAIERAPAPIQTLILSVGGLTAAFVALGIAATPVSLTIAAVAAAGLMLASAAGEAEKPVTDLTDRIKGLEEEAAATDGLESAARVYLDLSQKANLSADEHAKLKKAVKELSDGIPSSVTAFDTEGSAIGLDTAEVVKNIQARRDLVQLKLVDSLDEGAKNLAELSKELETTTRWIADLKAEEEKAFNGQVSFGRSIEDIMSDLTNASGRLKGYKSEIADVGNAFRALVAANPGKSVEDLVSELQKLGASGATIDYVKAHWEELTKSISSGAAKPNVAPVLASIEDVRKAIASVNLSEISGTQAVLEAKLKAEEETALSHASTNADKIKIEEAYALKVIEVQTKIALDSERSESKKKQIVEQAAAEEYRVKAETVNKLSLENVRMTDSVAKTTEEEIRLREDAEKATALSHELNASERIRIEEEYDLKASSLAEDEALKVAKTEEEKNAIRSKYAAERAKIQGDAASKEADRDRQVNIQIDEINRNTLTTYLDIEKEKEEAAAQTQADRIRIEEKYALESIKVKYDEERAKLILQGASTDQLKALDENYAAARAQIVSHALIELEKDSKDRIAGILSLADEAAQTVGKILDQSASADVSRLQKQLSDYQKNVDKRKQAELTAVEAQKKAQIQAIDERLNHENLSAEERKKLEAQKFDLETKFSDATDKINARYASEQSKREDELNRQIAEAKTRQAEEAKAVALAESIVQTARAVVEALPNIPLAVAVGVMGAAQTATIAAQEIPAFHTGTDDKAVRDIVKAAPSEEFVIKVRGGETIRTEDQEREIQDALRSAATLPKFHEGGVAEGGDLPDLSSITDYFQRRAQEDALPRPGFFTRPSAFADRPPQRSQVANYYNTSDNRSDNSSRTIVIHMNGSSSGSLKDDIKRAVQEGMRELGVQDVNDFFRNSRSHVTILP
jgi:hypothetical protein